MAKRCARQEVGEGSPASDAEGIATPAGGVAEGVADRIAATLLEVAAKLDAQEKRLRRSLKEAAESGDLVLVRKILDVWDEGLGAQP